MIQFEEKSLGISKINSMYMPLVRKRSIWYLYASDKLGTIQEARHCPRTIFCNFHKRYMELWSWGFKGITIIKYVTSYFHDGHFLLMLCCSGNILYYQHAKFGYIKKQDNKKLGPWRRKGISPKRRKNWRFCDDVISQRYNWTIPWQRFAGKIWIWSHTFNPPFCSCLVT